MDAKTKEADRGLDKVHLYEALELRYQHNCTLQEVADKYGVSRQAIDDRIQRFLAKILNPEELRAFRQRRADLWDSLEHRGLTRALDMAEKSSGAQATMMAGVAFDKGRLLRGESTANLGLRSTVEHATDMLDAINGELADLNQEPTE